MKEDWIEVLSGEILDIRDGTHDTPKYISEQTYPLVTSKNLKNGVIDFSNIKYISEQDFTEINKRSKVDIGDILFAMIGTIGNPVLVKTEPHYSIKNIGLFKNPLKIIKSELVKYYLDSLNFYSQLEERQFLKGTTQKFIPLGHLRNIHFPLAPLPIQRAIVSKIEALFSDLDNGIANFKKAQEQLKIYRQAVLKKAFEGGFSITNEELRITDSITNGELRITNEENHSSDNLPKGWKWVKLGEIGKIKGGKRLPPKHSYAENNTGYLYIMAGNLKDGTVKNKRTFINKETFDILSNYKVIGSEVYITIVGACIGDAGIIPENIGNAILTENAAKIIELKGINNKFLALWLNSVDCQTEIKNNILSATLGKLALSRIATLSVPLPPTIEEQTQIVQEIESRLSVCDKMEQSITESIEKAEALRQSILKKAFEGKLLSEAEIAQCKLAADYEPASELLKKIQAEKLAKEQEKKKKPKTKK